MIVLERVAAAPILGFEAPRSTARAAKILARLRSGCSTRRKRNFWQPQWLLPSGGNDSTSFFSFVELSPEETILEHRDRSSYKVCLVTSARPDSGLSEVGGRIWLALIGHRGETALRCVESESRFQKGDIDVIDFLGPDLGKLEAIWIGPERGSWRLEEAQVSVVPGDQGSQRERSVYKFRGNGELLGDGGDVPAIELEPEADETGPSSRRSREDSIREYESFKVSLLMSHAALVAVGTGALTLSGWTNVALAFSAGGAAGFLYLYLLEGAVDRIGKVDGSGVFDSVGKPSTLIRVGMALALVTAALTSWELQGLTPSVLLAGAAGFLVYKLALVFAATRRSESGD